MFSFKETSRIFRIKFNIFKPVKITKIRGEIKLASCDWRILTKTMLYNAVQEEPFTERPPLNQK